MAKLHKGPWPDFLAGNGPELKVVARVDPSIVSLMGALDDRIFIARHYAHKLRDKHSIADMGLIGQALWRGEVLHESEGRMCFIYYDVTATQRWYLAAIKVAKQDRLFYITTFHRTKPSQIRKKRQKARIVRIMKE